MPINFEGHDEETYREHYGFTAEDGTSLYPPPPPPPQPPSFSGMNTPEKKRRLNAYHYIAFFLMMPMVAISVYLVASTLIPLMEWWFWVMLAVGFSFLAGVYFLNKADSK